MTLGHYSTLSFLLHILQNKGLIFRALLIQMTENEVLVLFYVGFMSVNKELATRNMSSYV